jgi:hypothetical protein
MSDAPADDPIQAIRERLLHEAREMAEMAAVAAVVPDGRVTWSEPYLSDLVKLLRDAAAEVDRLRAASSPAPLDESPLRKMVEYVLQRFEKDEADGYRSKDRQFAIDVLRKGLELSSASPAPSGWLPRTELWAYLTQVIHGDNIGDVRRSLFMPWDCIWNDWVRDETAAREVPPPVSPVEE